MQYVYMYMYMHILTQTGMQPIHSAASNGHIDVINVLVEKYGVDPQEKAEVCTLYTYVYNACI